jgi:hypothetical protein
VRPHDPLGWSFEKWAKPNWPIDQASVIAVLKNRPGALYFIAKSVNTKPFGKPRTESLKIVSRQVVDKTVSTKRIDQRFAGGKVVSKRPGPNLAGVALLFFSSQEVIAKIANREPLTISTRSSAGQ